MLPKEGDAILTAKCQTGPVVWSTDSPPGVLHISLFSHDTSPLWLFPIPKHALPPPASWPITAAHLYTSHP